MRKIIKVVLISTVMVAALMPVVANATGEASCQVYSGQKQASETAYSSSYIAGARATIEGQTLPLCTGSPYYSGSFHWASLENIKSTWSSGNDIVQVGVGHCSNVNNSSGLGTVCNGSYYNYWAWGSQCGGAIDGTLPGVGPIAIRIGSPLSNPPPSNDYYVLRENIGGTIYYDGYVNGTLLSGVDALGNSVIARVAASKICWDSDQTDRRLAWFGEVFNSGDSMGGWVGTTQNHLDYNPLNYTVGSGWIAPTLVGGNPCNGSTWAPLFTCTIAAANHIYIDTTR